MAAIKLNYKTTKRLARAVIALHGRDFVYNPTNERAHRGGCYYVPVADFTGAYVLDLELPSKQATGCIVGRILLTAVPSLVEFLKGSRTSISSLYNDGDLPHDQVIITPKALHFLQRMQIEQDVGESWGDSYDMAVSHTLENFDPSLHAPTPTLVNA